MLTKLLRSHRVQRRRTLGWLAREMGVTVSYLSDVEKGRRSLTVERVEQVIEKLRLTEDEAEVFRGAAALQDGRVVFDVSGLGEEARRALRALKRRAAEWGPDEWGQLLKLTVVS